MGEASSLQKKITGSSLPALSLAQQQDPHQSLMHLCDLVVTLERPYEDVAEQIEDKAYELCESGKIAIALHELSRVVTFFEQLEAKNEEHCRDLADVYLLIGQIYQFASQFAESISWFSKAAIVDDRYPAPFHSLATSYNQMHEYNNAVKSLEQEIYLAPGNYYSYLLLVDIYEQEGRLDDVEKCLKRLLERDPENIQGLHRLIRYYEQSSQSIDTTLLMRRLMMVSKAFNRIEAVIRAYYLCKEEKFQEVLEFLDSWQREAHEVTIMYLVKAHVFSHQRLYAKRRQVLRQFKEHNHGREVVMRSKLHEFALVFGMDAASHLTALLLFSPQQPKIPN